MNNVFSLKRYIPMSIAALLILSAAIMLWYFPKEYAYRLQWDQNLNPADGAWDLTSFDLDNQIAFLEGGIEYVPGMLLTPEEFEMWEGEIQEGRNTANGFMSTANGVMNWEAPA